MAEPDTDEKNAQGSTLGQCVSKIVAHYQHFAGMQEQKLRLADYVLRRQDEIDDPAAAARSILKARYPHVEAEKFEVMIRGLSAEVEAARNAGHETEQEVFGAISDQLSEVMEKATADLPDGYAVAGLITYLQLVLATLRTGGTADDLRASLFTGLIADFESFLVSIMGDLYKNDPRKLMSRERTVSWAAIFEMTDLDTFRDDLIEDAVVDIMRGSLDDWMAALARDHKITVEQSSVAWAKLVEMLQRRHVLIHNGGRASRLYISKCPNFDVEAGEVLSVSPSYLSESADRLAVLALEVTVRALVELEKSRTGDVESVMCDLGYELLFRRRYQAVFDYLDRVPMDRMVNQTAVLICQVNRWLAMKRLGRFDECRSDVEAWDVAPLGDQYKLARLALLGETSEAADLCRSMRDQGRLSLKHWVEWPLLEEVRAHEERGLERESDAPAEALLVSGDQDRERVRDEH